VSKLCNSTGALTIHPSGDIYFCNLESKVNVITSTGEINTVVTLPNRAAAIFIDSQGTIFVGADKTIYKINHRHEVFAIANLGTCGSCEGITADHEGNLYFSASYSIYKIDNAAAASNSKLIKDIMKVNELTLGKKYTVSLRNRNWDINHELVSIRCPALLLNKW